MTEVRTAKGARKPRNGPAQLSLFDTPLEAPAPLRTPVASAPVDKVSATVSRPRGRVARPPEIMTLKPEDMPDYPLDLVTQVEQEIAAIPTDRVLLTYKEIWDYFGVSRATVVRRMKDGLVPGIRMSGGRVLDDGPVRRLSRVQVRWLLLAVRRRRSA
ncbi:MAG: hypothetical protein JNL81_12005 [Hyphomonadaceae bacterium]|nr:hypothetical protein [Hyphomonadaceae bacterium]